jgi:hypothetical protein
MEIDKEMVRASKGFRAVARQCGKMGWEEVEVGRERVIDRRTLVGITSWKTVRGDDDTKCQGRGGR